MSVPGAFLSQLRIRKSAVFSGYSLLVYDYLVTFPLEVQHIWNAPWNAIKAVFLLNRYGNLVGQTFLVLEETGLLTHGSSKFCRVFWSCCPLFMLISAESIRVLVLMRACAIWGCMHRAKAISIGLSIFYALATIAVLLHPLTNCRPGSIPFLYVNEVDVCVTPIIPRAWVTWLVTIGLDSLALGMVWYGLRKLCRESRDVCPSPLVHLLIRDACLFYTSSLFNNLLSILCWTVFRDDPRNLIYLGLTFPLLSVVGQRLVFTLRGFRARAPSARDVSREVDRQMADMNERVWRLWSDLGAETEPHHPDHSEDAETRRSVGLIDDDIEL